MAAFDGTAILHRDAFRDCASISLGGGSGTTQTTLGDAPWVLLHESGHFLFGMETNTTAEATFRSPIRRTSSAARRSASRPRRPTACPRRSARRSARPVTWRNDDGVATTMEDRTLSSDFRTLAGKVMANKVVDCVNGACY
jgi:hypothetical protein